jgi:hypothetical protein
VSKEAWRGVKTMAVRDRRGDDGKDDGKEE